MRMGLAQTARLGILAGESKTKVRYLCSRLNWNMSFRKGAHESRQPGTRGTCWVSSGKAKVDFKFKCNVFKATTQGALLSRLCACAGQSGSFAVNELFPLERCQNKLA